MRSLLMATALCAVVVMLTGCSFTANSPRSNVSHQSRLNGCGCGAGDSCNSCDTRSRPGLLSRFGGRTDCATGDCGMPAPAMTSACGCGSSDCGPTCGGASTDCGCGGNPDCGCSGGGLFGRMRGGNSIGGGMGMRLNDVGSECSTGAAGCGRFGCGRSGKLCMTCGAKSRLGGGRVRAMGSRCQSAGGCDAAGGCGGAGSCRGLAGGGRIGGRVRAMGGRCQAAGGCEAPGGCGGAGGCRGLQGGGMLGGTHTKPYGGDIPHTAENPMMGGGQVPQYVYPYYTTRGPRDFLNTNPPSIGY